jgi:hypothetical protein
MQQYHMQCPMAWNRLVKVGPARRRRARGGESGRGALSWRNGLPNPFEARGMRCGAAASLTLTLTRVPPRPQVGLPATIEHRKRPTDGSGGGARAVAETVQHFITAMDSLKLNLVAVDQVGGPRGARCRLGTRPEPRAGADDGVSGSAMPWPRRGVRDLASPSPS